MTGEQPRDSKGRFLSHGLIVDGLPETIGALHAAMEHGTFDEVEQNSQALALVLKKSIGATPDETEILQRVISHPAREIIPTATWNIIEQAAINARQSTAAIRSEIDHKRLTARAKRSHRGS